MKVLILTIMHAASYHCAAAILPQEELPDEAPPGDSVGDLVGPHSGSNAKGKAEYKEVNPSS